MLEILEFAVLLAILAAYHAARALRAIAFSALCGLLVLAPCRLAFGQSSDLSGQLQARRAAAFALLFQGATQEPRLMDRYPTAAIQGRDEVRMETARRRAAALEERQQLQKINDFVVAWNAWIGTVQAGAPNVKKAHEVVKAWRKIESQLPK